MYLVRPAALGAAMLVATAASLPAQATLRPGSTARGELKSGDLKLDDDTWADLWRFSGSAGQVARVTMRSKDFDSYLVVGYYDDKGEFTSLESDDDGAGEHDSRVELRLPRDGEYVARANTLSEGESGAYTLDLELTSGAGGGDRAAGRRARAEVTPGQKVRGTLTAGDEKIEDDSYADSYRFSGQGGQRVTITLDSEDFDAFLHLGRETGGKWEELETDDDGGGETNSRIEYTLPDDGEYVIRANTLSEGETGDYTLRLELGGAGETPRPPVPVGTGLVSTTPGARMQLTLGATLRGRLEQGDELLSDGSPADIWVYRGTRGETLTMIQRSADHDAYLTFGPVRDGRWLWSESNDDDGGGKDAKLVVTLKEDGEYWVRPNALNKGTGRYTLVVTSSRGGDAPRPEPRRAEVRREQIRAGDTVRGELSESDEFNFDTTYVDTYVYKGKRGEQLTILMLSPSFGSYVLFGKAVGDPEAFSSLDSKGAVRGAEAELVVTVPEDGDYWIRANSFEKTLGSYVLTVKSRRR